jgi:hypothetical protein
MQKPKAPVRRFDVFAEYNRQKAIAEGQPEDEAEGYGLWVAKVVASRGFGRGLNTPVSQKQGADGKHERDGDEQAPKPKWHSLGGEPQTDELFQKEIVRRMGEDFYDSVFRPAIEEAISEDRTYTSIRDTIRRDWKP